MSKEIVLVALPFAFPPAPGESWHSWVDRLAAAHDIPLGAAIDAVGVPRTASGNPLRWGTWLDDDTAADVARATDTDPETVHGTLLWHHHRTGALDLTAIPGNRQNPARHAARTWALTNRTRLCPFCVEEDDHAMQLRWRLGTSAVCTRHEVLLIDTCPLCRHFVRSGGSRAPQPHGLGDVPYPGNCENPGLKAEGRPCWMHFCDLPTASLMPGPLLGCQARVDALADGLDEARLNGRPVPISDWFATLRDAFALLMRYGTADDLVGVSDAAREAFAWCVSDRGRGREKGEAAMSYRVAPVSASVVGACLPTVVDALDGDDLEEGLGFLFEHARRSGHARWRSLPDTMGFSPATRRAFEDFASPWVRPSDAAWHLRNGMPQDGRRFGGEHVPALAPVEWWEHVAPALPNTLDRVGRTFLSLSLVKVAERCSWPEAGVALGIDANYAARRADRCIRNILDPEQWWAAVHDIALAVEDQPLTDYGARRTALRGLVELEEDVWRHMCGDVGAHPGRGPARRRNAAAWAWAEVTGGHPWWSPAMTACEAGGERRESLREVYRRFEAWVPEPLADLLVRHAMTVVEHGTGNGEAA